MLLLPTFRAPPIRLINNHKKNCCFKILTPDTGANSNYTTIFFGEKFIFKYKKLIFYVKKTYIS